MQKAAYAVKTYMQKTNVYKLTGLKTDYRSVCHAKTNSLSALSFDS